MLLLCVALAACGTPKPEITVSGYPGPTPLNVFRTPEAPASVPSPAPGRATVGGALFSFTTKMLVPGTLLYLTPAVGPEKRDVPAVITGPDDSHGDYRGQTNDLGQFIITDVTPGNYYIVVAAPLSWSLGVAASGDEKPLLVELKADQALSLGIVYLSWP